MWIPLLLILQTGSAGPAIPTACAMAQARGPAAVGSDFCKADEARKAALAALKGSAERTRALEAAASGLERGANLERDVAIRKKALFELGQLLDSGFLDQSARLELVLRDLIALDPADFEPRFQLARLQERQNFLDAAEETLLAARRQNPQAIEPNKELAQFYVRRVTALSVIAAPPPPRETAVVEPDVTGVYRVGGEVKPPPRVGVPKYPTDAQAAGIQGVVIAEIVVSEQGEVVDARVVRSVPLLDDAALAAVRTWRYDPTLVNGQPVPVRMTVTVNFSTR